jgi:Holliday junction resolvase
MNYTRRVDANQREIVDALKEAGASVCDLSGCGKGVPDILIGYNGRNILAEIKRPWAKGIAKADLELTPPQVEFFDAWLGQVAKITTIEEALELLKP